MASWDIRILSGSYSNENDKVVIEIYGKTRSHESAVIRYHDFLPYFFLVEPPDTIEQELKADPDVIETKTLDLLFKGKQQRCLKVIIKFPFNVPKYRNRYRDRCDVLAADIPFIHRFMYDLDLGGCVTVTGDLVPDGSQILERYTTPLVIEAKEFEPCEPFKPNLKILSFDIENSISSGMLYTLCCAIRWENKELTTECLHGTEKEIIEGFKRLVYESDPDVITGYNIDGYDIPTLRERAKLHRMGELTLGRNRTGFKEVSNRFWRLSGRLIADAWWNAKRELRPKQETLNYVAKSLLGEEKGDVNPQEIDREWSQDPEKVMEYCKKDAILALKILEKIEVLDKFQDLSTVSKLPLDDVLNGRTSSLIDSILIREADRRGIGVPCTHHTGKREKIEGGFVLDVEPGLSHWVCVLDFKAMYPSIMIGNNICFLTLTKDPGKDTITSPVGANFLRPEAQRGLIPDLLRSLMADREKWKVQMKTVSDEDQKKYYNGLQDAVKILMNSFYGVMASSFYRFTDPIIGASITAFARERIKGIIEQLRKEEIEVIYSDTDSIFVRSPKDGLENALKFGERLAKRFSKGHAVLEFEKILQSFFTHGKKKRYVGQIVWPKEERLVRGYEIRRTDSFDLQSEALTAVFDHVLDGDIDGGIKTARQSVIDTLNGNVPTEKLVISRTVQDESHYKNPEALPYFRTAQKLKKMGYEVVPGMKVSWIVTDGHKVPQGVEPYIDGRKIDKTPDWKYYAERLALSLARVTDVFDWDHKNLLTGAQQSSLFDGFDSGSQEPDVYEDGKTIPVPSEIDDPDDAINEEGGNRDEAIDEPDKGERDKKKGPTTLDSFL